LGGGGGLSATGGWGEEGGEKKFSYVA
jgi:hypothetical protein